MTQKIYVVEGRQFRTETDYNRALRDGKLIEQLRSKAAGMSTAQLKQLKAEILQQEKYQFYTILEQDFLDELEELIAKSTNAGSAKGKRNGSAGKSKAANRKLTSQEAAALDEVARQELRRQEKRRKQIGFLCGVVGIICLSYFAMYLYYDYKTGSSYEELSALKEKPPVIQSTAVQEEIVEFTRDDTTVEPKEVLDEYKNLLNKNKKLIGWVKIDDTNIDYPVMQTSDNEYYLDHNLNQEYDKNGSIFMDKDCDVITPSTNYILYGHHMKSGKMFGDLDKYESKAYYEKHPYIQFDTIYEKGTYQIMYVFRSRVYSETEIVFKYYQFIDAYSETEFDSYMKEMAALSLYDTGITAQYGDRLLTLSTCDYQEKGGRFVVVAKKIAEE